MGHLLLQIKCIARLDALESDSCIDDNKLQLQDNLEYYFILRQIANLVNKIENLIPKAPAILNIFSKIVLLSSR